MTLQDLFNVTAGDVAQRIGSSKSLPALKDVLHRTLPALDGNLVTDQVAGKVLELLDVKLGNVFAGLWNKYRALKQYTDRERYPPDKTVIAALAKHSVRSHYEPYIDVSVNGQSIGRLVCEVDLEITLEALQLEIKDARITRLLGGSYSGKGTIAMAGAVLVETPFPSRPLPGSIELGKGIDLRRDSDRQ
jgi:hypothetical protein